MHAGWSAYVRDFARVLEGLAVSDELGAATGTDAGLARWVELAGRVRAERQTIFFIGNGASASMASHFSADVAKNGRIRTQVFTDPALVTALGNDLGYEHVFAQPLALCAGAGDMLVAISSSGRSPNILAAARVARELQLHVITLSAMQPDNPLRGLGKLNFYLPATTYGHAETAHAALLHQFMDAITPP